ncbi:MAG: hypothetical protein KBB67_04160 [Syntrophorhabdus sp.]|nr:hypothetical protein [Syntrophorhabdus sp.]MBP8698995.1 hypothetical protein [Syntrophorhabdaceae bacterium]OPX95032.1 MAG: hypothetical protein A4E59_01939 [Syntrophorhabdus sp. PtaB.Bin027]OQB77411.1 MAG: hypothetical protein BWX92_00888 [Deltaproteobacteria bacterium ADurb.Bin135]
MKHFRNVSLMGVHQWTIRCIVRMRCLDRKKVILMRAPLKISDELPAEVQKITGALTKTEAIVFS